MVVDGKQRTESITHRMILGLGSYESDRRDVDHIDPMATTDNRRSNLRVGTHRQNSHNRRPNLHTKANLKGVAWHNRDKIYEASIRINGKLRYLGRDFDPIKCHLMYCEKRQTSFREICEAKVKDNPVLLLARNCLELTKRCVESIHAQDIPTYILVIDNASTDGTFDWLQDNQIHTVRK